MVSTFYDDGHSGVTAGENPAESAQTPLPQRLTRSQQDDLLRAVQVWYDAGCAVHPAKIDGSKYAIAVRHGSPDIQPATFPDTYQHGRLAGMPHPQAGQPHPDAGQHGYGWGRIATGDLPRLTPQQIAAYVRAGRADGIGVFCGLASGGLLMLEAEGRARSLLPKVREAAISQGSLELLERLTGCVDESPSGGIHFYLRVTGGPTPGNQVLAARPSAAGKDVLFETRGQGGWSVVAPSSGRTHKSGKPYRFLRGGPATIPEFTLDELERLFAAFRAVDEMPPPEPAPAQSADIRRRDRPAGDILPGDDFNQRASWEEILTGWKPGPTGGERRTWTRPGKDHGTSATTTADVLCCYSSATALPQFTGTGCKNALSKFATYAHLHHGGDFKSAARELWNQGYGSRHDDHDQGDDGQPLPVEPRPAPTGQCRSLADWRQEVAGRRAAAISQPGLHLDRSPTGSGKTHATITSLAAASSSLTVLPTHANVAERVEEMRSQGIDAVAYPELTAENCQNYDQASQAQSLGLVAGAAVCPGCPFQDGCTYQAGVKAASKADHRVATHERLRRSAKTAEGVQVVVVDEIPESVVAPTLTVPVGRITAVHTLAHGIKNWWHSQADHDQKTFAGALLDVVAAINGTCAGITQPGTVTVDLQQVVREVPKNWQRLLFQSIRQVGVGKDLSAEALTLVTKAAAGDLVRLEIVTDLTKRGRLHHFVVGSWRPGLPAGAAVILLDATGQADDIAAATGLPVDDCTPDGHLPLLHQVVQVVDDISRGTSAATVAGVVEAFLERHPGVRLGIIGHQPHITALIDQGELAPAARQQVVKWCYFGQGPDRASNDWHRECDHLLVLGTPRANPGDHRRWLAQHGLHDAAGRPDGDWGARHWESVTVAGTTITVAGTGYRDPDWHRAFVAVSRSTLHQAVGRGRSILPDGIPVTVVSSEPTPYPIAPALDAQPAALRATVAVVQGLLAPPDVSELPAIGNPYREKYGNGAVPTGDIVQAVVEATRTADKPAGVGRRAAEKRLRQCLEAGLLAQPKRGWWMLPGTPAPPADDLVLPVAQPIRAAAPAILTPLQPAVVIEAVPPESTDDAVQIVSPAILPAVTTDTSTADPAPPAPVFDAVLELVEERAAILEYDAGHDRQTADRLAREMVLGRDAAAAVPTGPTLTAGVDHAALHARGLPLVAAALERMPGRVRVLAGDQEDPFAGRRRSGKPAPGHCTCGASNWARVPIHGGKSARVDCGHCDRFGWFAVWYGKRQQPPWPDDDLDPSLSDQQPDQQQAVGDCDRLSFSPGITVPSMPTGPAALSLNGAVWPSPCAFPTGPLASS